MGRAAAPENKFGFAECCPGPCPPESDIGLAAYHLGIPVFFVVVVVSLVAGVKISSQNRLLPVLALVAVGAIIAQLSREKIVLETYQNHNLIRRYEDGPSAKDIARYDARPLAKNKRYVDLFEQSARRAIPYAKKEISEIPDRYRRIFIKGWLAYSALPFTAAMIITAFRRRKRTVKATSSNGQTADGGS